MTCNFCGGVAHPATGCVYGPSTIACVRCTRDFWRWVKGHTNGKSSKRSRKHPGMISFYEAAGKKP